MNEISIETLMRAIGALVSRSEALVRRLGEVSPEVDASEHLSEEIELIDQALNELGDAYERRRGTVAIYPPVAELMEKCRGT